MYSLELSVVNLEPSSEKEFKQATDVFLNKLSSLPNLDIKLQRQEVPGSRGAITLLSGIILTGINLGAFSAIYTIYKDLSELYANAEIQLHFDDGSTITLNNLTQQEAEQILKKHLEKLKPNSKP